jgi:Ca2+-transporting ATPase
MAKEKEQVQALPGEKLPSYSTSSVEEALKGLGVGIEQGLTSTEVASRTEKYGPNQLQEAPKRTFLQMVLDQLKSFVIILLIVAAAISGLLGEWIDAVAILLIVILNAVMGVIQESRAEEALAALKKMASPEAHIIRDGKRVTVPSSELVP